MNETCIPNLVVLEIDEILATCPICGHVSRFTFYGGELVIYCPDYSCPNYREQNHE